MTFAPPEARARIYSEAEAERLRQELLYGFQLDLPIVLDADRKLIEHEQFIKRMYDLRSANGTRSHGLIALEEIAELIWELNPNKRRAEAIQAIACLVKLVEAIDWQESQK